MGLNNLETKDSSRFITIIGGKLAEKVNENELGAVKRTYEKSTGETGEKWERYYTSITGKIGGIEFKQTDFGEQCYILFKDGMETFTLSLATDSDYFTTFAKKLKGIDSEKEITVKPYDFENKESKRYRGVSIFQNDLKLENHYYNVENKEYVNGFPTPEGDTTKYDKDDWKLFYIKVKKFLKSEISSIQFAATEPIESAEPNIEDDLPF